MNQPTDQTNAEADEGNDHEEQQKRITCNGSNERANPRNRRCDDAGNTRENASHTTCSRCFQLNTPLNKINDLNYQLNRHEEESNAKKVYARLRKQKRRQLLKEPKHKICHTIQSKHPLDGKGKK